MYSGLTTRVEWLGELSESFPVLQGVRQGGILSTHPDPDLKGRMQLTLLVPEY